MDNSIGIAINIKTQVRIRVLFDVISELCRDFDFPEKTKDVLYKGIVLQHILGSIYAHYLDDNDESVGLVRFNIDWAKHEIYADTTMGKQITLRTDIPLIEQFALWSTDIIQYVKIMQQELNVKTVYVFYQYRDEVKNDPIADKKADEFLGLKNSSKKIKFNTEKGDAFERKIKLVSEMLPELKIEIQSNK